MSGTLDQTRDYLLGIDVGSTTVKIGLVASETAAMHYHRYRRHGAEQRACSVALLRELAHEHPDLRLRPIFTGSGGRDLATAAGVGHIQEVVANSLAVRRFHPQARVAVELGGQDAKVIFFRHDPATGDLNASDMRMNGSCAGGTGAFIDEVARLLQTPVERFDQLAAEGRSVYQISGRCGVFAKTDIQPLLNQGIARSDLALSTFHAVARQTIGGLAQGLQIVPPVIFQGGPLTFNATLIDVFAERLELSEDQVIRPQLPEVFVAHGAALAIPVLFPETATVTATELADALEAGAGRRSKAKTTAHVVAEANDENDPLFADAREREEFERRHQRPDHQRRSFTPGTCAEVWIGIDAGSTTTKIALLDDDGALLDSAYAHNEGSPLATGARMLAALLERYEAEGVELVVRGVGTTGYGERLFAAAFRADYHTVETVAHAHAALREAPDAGFVLDIGGQDMKAITIADGIVTGISLNEACSAGCGSFLENFAANLNVPLGDIAPMAFAATAPSRLGSRCTVFMNSSIITEQKNGKKPEDIMAGLCRSIVENVFTKVVRVPNFAMLGETVVVQGGTFENDAVLRALEQYTERRVVRAPFPGLMGAIGVGLLTREARAAEDSSPTTFVGLERLRDFEYEQHSGVVCSFCTNACSRTVVRFADGTRYVTGNRCERGQILDRKAEAALSRHNAVALPGAQHDSEPSAHEGIDEQASRERLRAIAQKRRAVPNLMAERDRLLNTLHPVEVLRKAETRTIGIPRALEFWNSLPFWRSFWTALGFEVVVSSRSTQELYESGVASVPSDTVCFPAKLAHGHIRNLAERGVDRIFMPMINRMPPENPDTTSDHVCAVVKGYPLVLDISDEPGRRHGIPFDRPMFHWVDARARRRQVEAWVHQQFDIEPDLIRRALDVGDREQAAFQTALTECGREVLEGLQGSDTFGVVIAGRPYHSDQLVNHDLADLFVEMGIPVLTADSLPDLHKTDLRATRAELTINFHVRMYAAALQVCAQPNLELVQVVSFGCGHDAVISDEVVRLMEHGSGKAPLTLKLDETDVRGPMAIRVRSFIETIRARRERTTNDTASDKTPATVTGKPSARFAFQRLQLPDPFPVKYRRRDRREKVIMAPNVSRAFAQVISAAIRAEGYRIEPLPLADRRAVELGKRYIHNDMCFPAQINVGEMLGALERGVVDPEVAVCGLAKSQCDCRLAHYAGLARRALDDAGYPQVPIITTDKDTKNMHPGFRLSPLFQLRMLWALGMVDALESLRLRLRPYERESGTTDRIFEDGMQRLATAIERSTRRALAVYREIVAQFAAMPVSENFDRPQVFVIGEFLLNFHPTSNFDIVRYLEANGMEVVLPPILDVFRRDFMRMKTERRDFFVRHPLIDTALSGVTDMLFDHVLDTVAEIAAQVPRYVKRVPLPQIAELSEEIVHHTFTSGEGWMIAGDILHHAAHGIRSFLILQPFGCLPNHITGRGLIKRLKEIHPDAQILSLDYDPDTSFANVENRLQMLIMNTRIAAGIGA